MNQLTKFAIIVPCFNEESRLNLTYWRRVLAENPDCTWLFVDDGSKDNTIEKLEIIAKGDSNLVLPLSKNMGKAEAIRLGILHLLSRESNFEWIGYLDSDGAFSTQDIHALVRLCDEKLGIDASKTIDVVIASRVALAGRKVKRNPRRHYLGRIIATVVCRNWSESPYDTQSGYKIFANSQFFEEAIQNPFRTQWFVDIELITRIGLIKPTPLIIWEEPVTTWQDVAGSKLNFRDYFKVLMEARIARSRVKRLIDHQKGPDLDGPN